MRGQACQGRAEAATRVVRSKLCLNIQRCSKPECRLAKHESWGPSDDRQHRRDVRLGLVEDSQYVAGYRFWVAPGSRGYPRALAFLADTFHVTSDCCQALPSLLLTMMDASQPQCADLHSLAEALAVDFVRGGTSVSSQTPRLMKQAFPDAPALRCWRMPVNSLHVSIRMKSVRIRSHADADATGACTQPSSSGATPACDPGPRGGRRGHRRLGVRSSDRGDGLHCRQHCVLPAVQVRARSCTASASRVW